VLNKSHIYYIVSGSENGQRKSPTEPLGQLGKYEYFIQGSIMWIFLLLVDFHHAMVLPAEMLRTQSAAAVASWTL
jgi:hypothetical protein